jgi:outer membrane protein assembly factor BamB
VGTPFDNGGGSSAIGIITGITVDYATNYVYFTSRAAGGGSSHTLWCLNATGGVLAKVWSLAVGDVDGSPVLYGGRIYVGTNTGQVRAVDVTTQQLVWTYPAAPGSDGPVKGYVTPDYGTTPLRLYYSTNETVWGLTLRLDGSGVDSFWSNATPSNPSTPLLLFGTAHLLVGCGDGTLQQLDTATGAVAKSVSVGTAALGSPAMDSVNGLAHVGSTAGVLHTVAAPIP